MADGNFRGSAAQGRSIRPTDLVFGADPTESDLSAAGRSDTLAEVIRTILRNPSSGLTTGEQEALQTAFGINPFTAADEMKLDAIPATAANRADEAFSNPPSDLSDPEQAAVRTAIGAGTGSSDGGGLSAVSSDSTLTGAGTSTDTLKVANPFTAADETKLDGIPATAAARGDEAFSNPPSDLSNPEQAAVRTAIGAGTGSGGGGLSEGEVDARIATLRPRHFQLPADPSDSEADHALIWVGDEEEGSWQETIPAGVLPDAEEATAGVVRLGTTVEAGVPSGTVARAWTASMVTKIIGAWRGIVPQADAEAGTSQVGWFWTPERIKQAIVALAGNTPVQLHEFTWSNSAAAVSHTDSQFNAHDYLTLEGYIAPSNSGAQGNREYISTALKRSEIPVSGNTFELNNGTGGTVRITLTAAGAFTINPQGAGTSGYGKLRVWGSRYPVGGGGAGGGGTTPPGPGAHDRLIGWSAGTVPTAAEIAAATIVADSNTLTIPSRTAGQDAHIFFGVPADPGLPTQLYFSNNPTLDQAPFFSERSEGSAGDFTRGSVAFSVMSTDNLLFASTYGTGSITLRLGYP